MYFPLFPFSCVFGYSEHEGNAEEVEAWAHSPMLPTAVWRGPRRPLRRAQDFNFVGRGGDEGERMQVGPVLSDSFPLEDTVHQ